LSQSTKISLAKTNAAGLNTDHNKFIGAGAVQVQVVQLQFIFDRKASILEDHSPASGNMRIPIAFSVKNEHGKIPWSKHCPMTWCPSFPLAVVACTQADAKHERKSKGGTETEIPGTEKINCSHKSVLLKSSKKFRMTFKARKMLRFIRSTMSSVKKIGLVKI
jgi:hypothetical protein